MNRYLLLVIALVFTIYRSYLSAQNIYDNYIYGYVTDQNSNRHIPGILVEVINQADTLQRAGVLTDISGRYVILLTDLGIDAASGQIVRQIELGQNYPNPFNPITIIPFSVHKPGHAKLVIYNILGQKIVTLLDQKMAAGSYSVPWSGLNSSGNGTSAGIYFYQLQTEETVLTKKMILLDGTNTSVVNNTAAIAPPADYWSKPSTGELLVTIRCTSPFTGVHQIQDVHVNSSSFRYDILLDYQDQSIIDPNALIISEPFETDRVFVSGLPGLITDRLYGTEQAMITNRRTGVTFYRRIDSNAGFRIIDMAAAVGDTIEVNILRNGIITGISQILPVEIQRPPLVKETKPTHGEKDIIIKTNTRIYFCMPMDPGSITDQTVFISDEQDNNVPGTITILENNTCVILDPHEDLLPLTNYRINILAGVKDFNGNLLGKDTVFTFTTAAQPNDPEIAFNIVTFNEDSEFPSDWGSIHTMQPDGSALTRMTKNNNVQDFQPDYDPNAEYIVFVRAVPPLDGPDWVSSDIYLMRADGTYPQNLTESEDLIVWRPSFSPDGNRILYNAAPELLHSSTDIYTMDISGYHRTNLTNDEYMNFQPSWTPDGRIIFISYRYGEWDIFIMDPDGGNLVNLTENLDGRCYSPACSPDGKKIAFFHPRRPQFLKILDIATGQINELVESETSILNNISWNPFSDKIINNTTIISLADSSLTDLIETSWTYRSGTADWAPVHWMK